MIKVKPVAQFHKQQKFKIKKMKFLFKKFHLVFFILNFFGWAGWIRTNACESQSLVPYRLATAQCKFHYILKLKLCQDNIFQPIVIKNTFFIRICISRQTL